MELMLGGLELKFRIRGCSNLTTTIDVMTIKNKLESYQSTSFTISVIGNGFHLFTQIINPSYSKTFA
jgi:hypothetical protein